MKTAELIASRAKSSKACRPVTIAFLGDSVTQGCFEIYPTGPRSLDTVYKPGSAYCHKLREIIETVFPSCPVAMINAGVSGDNAAGGLERLDRDVLSFKPDLAVVCFGLNDVCGGKEKMDSFLASIKGIFDKLREAKIETICLTPNMLGTYVSEEESNPFLREIIASIIKHQLDGTMDEYMNALRQLCEKEHVPLCDCYSKWKKLSTTGADTTRLLANGVNHPREEMHSMFAEALFNKIFDL